MEDDEINWYKQKYVSIVEKKYDQTTGAVVVDGLLIEWFSVSVGVRQGCLVSPTFFNDFLDFVWMKRNVYKIVLHIIRI